MEFDKLFDTYYNEYYKLNKRKKLCWELPLLILTGILPTSCIVLYVFYSNYIWLCLELGLVVLLSITYMFLYSRKKIKNDMETRRSLDKYNLLYFLKRNGLYNKSSIEWIIKKCNKKLCNEWSNSMERVFMNIIFPIIMLVLGAFLNKIASIKLIIVFSLVPILLSLLFYMIKNIIYGAKNILPFFKMDMYRFILDYIEYILATDFKCDLLKEFSKGK